ncbi:hypothetical protein ACFYNO_14560 [Kitasatospora sp. NPDC006697]|uniref:hypothetical protein n=1 Tax=unclassified Kitasatospora TaxID=2633591 RepID=UPI0036AD7490
MALTLAPEVELRIGAANARALREGTGLPEAFECYACGGTGYPVKEEIIASVLTVPGRQEVVIQLAHAGCTSSAVLSIEEFNAIVAERAHHGGAQLAGDNDVVVNGRVVGRRPEAQPMPDQPVGDCPAQGLHSVPDGFGTGEPRADRLIAASFARCPACVPLTLAEIESAKAVSGLLALIVNWAANGSLVSGSARGLAGQAALESWQRGLAGEVSRYTLEAAKRVTYLAGGTGGSATFEASRLEPYLHSLTRRQRRAIAEDCLDGLHGIAVLLGRA